MREILFRVWNGANYEYDVMVGKFGAFYVNPMNGGLDVDDSASLSQFNTKFSDNVVIEQFTGLKDRNGKMIFEGDIVRFIWWWFDGAERESELTGTIVYSSDNMSFQLKGVKNKEWRDFVGADELDMDYLTPFSELNFCDADFEVIGNIHDNHEMLS